MSEQIPLNELNKHLFAAMLPDTHGKKEAPVEPQRKPLKAGALTKVKAAEDAPDAE